jgi:hypothetical protein
MTVQHLTTAPTRLPAARSALPPVRDNRTRHTAALDALLTLWDALEAMPDDEVAAFLAGPAAPFLPLDVPAVLDALRRDRARRAMRGRL